MKVRAKSDYLWVLSRTVSDHTFTLIKAYNDVYGKNSDQWKLFEYYCKTVEWNRDQETKDWPNPNFASLKHRTYKWLVKALATYTDFANADVHRSLLEIKLQMHRGCYPELLEDFDELLPLLKQRELFFLWRETIDLETTAISKSLAGASQIERMQEMMAQRTEIRLRVDELERYTDLDLAYRLPLKARHEHDGIWDAQLAQTFADHPLLSDTAPLHSVRAKFQFYRLKIFAIHRAGDLQAIIALSKEMMALYAQHDWLVREDVEQYTSLLRQLIAFACEAGDKKTAIDACKMFPKTHNDDQLSHLLTADKMIWAKFLIAFYFGEQAIGDEAATLYLTLQRQLNKRLPTATFCWLTFFYARHALIKHDYNASHRQLELLLASKTELKIDMQTHVRTLGILCAYHLETDFSGFPQRCKAALKFVESKDVDTTVQSLIIKGMEKLAAAKADGKSGKPIWEKYRAQLSDLKTTNNHPAAFAFFDYQTFWDKLHHQY